MPAHTLYLTAEEQEHLFKKLPQHLQDAWSPSLKTETVDAYETEAELKERMTSTTYEDLPSMKDFHQSAVAAAEAGDLSTADFTKIPHEAFPRYFHSIGACGMSAMMQFTMHDPELNDEGLRAVASMSMIRHIILEANAAAKAA